MPINGRESTASQESQSIFDEFFLQSQLMASAFQSYGLEAVIDEVLSWGEKRFKSNAMAFWNEKQKLKSIKGYALALLSVPASSAPVERVFSVGGNILTPGRNIMTAEALSQIMTIKCNRLHERQ